MQTTILVTGSNGQLGQELQVLAPLNKNYKFIFTNKEILNITNDEDVKIFFKKNNIDFCINAAAYTSVDKAETEKEEALVANALAPKYLATECKKYDTKLIHISTDYVFDGAKNSPYIENDITNPINYYGYTKWKGEQNVLEQNSEAIIIRTSWVYSSFGNNFVKTMLRLMATKESINVINDQLGSPTYAKSLAQLILQIIAKNPTANGLYNYSSNSSLSWYDFALAIKEIVKSDCILNPIPTSAYPSPVNRSLYSVLSKEKIVKTLGVTFSNWKTELEECIKLIGAQNIKY